jgi:hypothetical protein
MTLILSPCLPASADTTPDESVIYSTAIRSVFPRWQFDDKVISLLVVENRTRINSYDGPDITDDTIRTVVPAPADVVADFRARNKTPIAYQPTLDLPGRIKSYESSCVKGQFPDGGWRKFYQDYPGSPGLLSVSAIGFNNARDRALVYVAHAYSDDGGKGHVFLLKKSGNKWIVAKHGVAWVWVGSFHATPNKSLDRSGGSVFRIKCDAAKVG